MRSGAAGYSGAVLLFFFRGVLLWLVVTFGALDWVFTFQAARTPEVAIGAYLGWLDSNTVFLLQRGPLRFFFPTPTLKWIPGRLKGEVTHRIRGRDLA